MIKYERLSEKTYGTLMGYHFEVKMYTELGATTIDPTEATKFFVVDPQMLVTIDREEGRITLALSSDEEFKNTKKLQGRLKALANEFLVNYTVRNYGKAIVPRDFAMDAKVKQSKELKKQEELDGRSFEERADIEIRESIGKMFGYRKTSYQKVNEVIIKVRHRRSVDEDKRGARARHIQQIVLEWGDSKYTMGTTNLPAARAMARHISNGGTIEDNVASYIERGSSLIQEMTKFLRYANSNSLINESTSDIIETIKEQITNYRTDFKRLAGVKTYGVVADRINEGGEPAINEDSEDTAVIKDKFTVKSFDEQFETLLPFVSQIMNERNTFLSLVEEQSNSPIYVKDLALESLIFEDVRYKIAHVMNGIAESCEMPELSKYLKVVSEKLIGGTLNEFEQSIISNVMNNIVNDRENIVESIVNEII